MNTRWTCTGGFRATRAYWSSWIGALALSIAASGCNAAYAESTPLPTVHPRAVPPQRFAQRRLGRDRLRTTCMPRAQAQQRSSVQTEFSSGGDVARSVGGCPARTTEMTGSGHGHRYPIEAPLDRAATLRANVHHAGTCCYRVPVVRDNPAG